jgi:hypothetical protein
MTLEQLIEKLQELVDDYEAGDWEVQIAQQPSYPLLGWLENISFNSKDNMVYLASGSASEYGKRLMWEEMEDLGEEEEEDEEEEY